MTKPVILLLLSSLISGANAQASASPTATPAVYLANGAFLLSSLPNTAFSGKVPSQGTIDTLTSAITSSVASIGCTRCSAVITKMTQMSSGGALYSNSRILSLPAAPRSLSDGAIAVLYKVSGSTSSQINVVSIATSTYSSFSSSLSSLVGKSFSGVTATVISSPVTSTTILKANFCAYTSQPPSTCSSDSAFCSVLYADASINTCQQFGYLDASSYVRICILSARATSCLRL